MAEESTLYEAEMVHKHVFSHLEWKYALLNVYVLTLGCFLSKIVIHLSLTVLRGLETVKFKVREIN